MISANYLGTLTACLAGLELTDYQNLQMQLMEQLPVATTIGYMTADGTIAENEEDLPRETQELYEKYRIMAYNHLFDEENHPEDFYS